MFHSAFSYPIIHYPLHPESWKFLDIKKALCLNPFKQNNFSLPPPPHRFNKGGVDFYHSNRASLLVNTSQNEKKSNSYSLNDENGHALTQGTGPRGGGGVFWVLSIHKLIFHVWPIWPHAFPKVKKFTTYVDHSLFILTKIQYTKLTNTKKKKIPLIFTRVQLVICSNWPREEVYNDKRQISIRAELKSCDRQPHTLAEVYMFILILGLWNTSDDAKHLCLIK